MSSLKRLYGNSDDESAESNFHVDYVVHIQIPPKERVAAEASFVQLIEALTKVGLATEVRNGSDDSLLVFTKVASHEFLHQQVYRARLQDWLHGVRSSSPDKNVSSTLEDEPITEAERSRLVYLMITKPQNEGGAGIVVGTGTWKYVKSIFPLHNHAFNKAWIQKWSKKYLLDQADLDEIRDHFGENVAFYFAFVQSYFRFLIFPSAIGFGAWMVLGQFSTLYALISCFWSVVFFEYWKQKEVDLAVQWGVRGVSNIQHPRPQFKWEYEAEDPVTGEPVKVYDPIKRVKTQLLQVPFALVCIVVLGSLVVACNSLEVFINEVYSGGGKQYLTFLPTVLLCTLTPTFSTVLMKAAETLTEWENYETIDAHNAALIQKQFVLNFMTSYMALLFTTFVYIPFGEEILLPFLDFWHATAQTLTFSEKPLPTKSFEINPARISNQMFYFTVTAQLVNFATEVVVPYVKRQAFDTAKDFQQKEKPEAHDHPEEVEFLKRVRHECELEDYDVSSDYREMVIQYGYLSMFSVAWPLASVCFLINNWVELRSDAVKIAIGSKRPIPWRSDSIGPWLTALGFLSWSGSVTSSAIVFLCSGSKNGKATTSNVTAWTVLSGILLSEHFYFLTQMVVRFVMGKYESQGLQKERKERFRMKRQLLEETLGQSVAEKAAAPGIEAGEKITRAALEEEARQTSIKGQGTAEQTFWQRQRGMGETIAIGRRFIEQKNLEK